MQFKYFSIKEIQNFFIENNLSIIKAKGQNFLINAGAVDSILNKALIKKDDLVVEIGCGLGSLTHKILKTDCHFIGFEIDRAYSGNLRFQFENFENFHLIEGDFLKKLDQIKPFIDKVRFRRILFIGNLPYNITTPIFEKIFKDIVYFDDLIFMVQKEVALRITAKPGTRAYGSLSIFCQFYSHPKIILNLSPKSFYPAPKVFSAVVHFKRKEFSDENLNKDLFFKLVRSLFMNRRKQLKNNLLKSPLFSSLSEDIVVKALNNLNISLTIRGEILSIEEIIKLTNELDKFINKKQSLI